MDIRLTILGNNSALPAYGRHPTAQVVEIREQQFLVDCGEGTQIQMQRYGIKRRRINYIFISHLHGDHYFGLIGLLNSMGLMGRSAPLYLFGPALLKEVIDVMLNASNTILPYEIIFTALLEGESAILVNSNYYKITSFPVEHKIACHGFSFTAKAGGRKLLPEACKQYQLPAISYPLLKRGDDYLRNDGFLVKNEWVTTDGPKEKKYVYCADTRFTLSFLEHVRDADVIYHESTYLHDQAEKAAERFHSTAQQAAELAKTANAGKLLLGHFSSKYQELQAFHEEASIVFPNVSVTEEGSSYDI